MRILVLTMNIPFPPVGGGRMRTYQFVRALAAAHDVTLAGFSYGDTFLEAPDFPVNLVEVPWREPAAYAAMAGGDAGAIELLESGPEPWFASVLDSPAMEQELDRLDLEQFDVVLVEETDMARFLGALPASLPVVLDLHNVYSANADDARTAVFEQSAVSRARLCLVCSEVDARRARRLLAAEHVHVVENGVDMSFFAPTKVEPVPRSLVFTGTMDYMPNVEAVRWFAEAVLPAIRTELPDVRLDVVGANPAEEVLALASDSVFVHGRVPDVRPYFGRAEQVVVPLRSGGGTRLKVLEAAASGKAIVSTSIGCEGLTFVPGRDLVVADGVEDIVQSVVALSRDLPRRDELGANARQHAQRYEWERIGARLRSVVEGVVALV